MQHVAGRCGPAMAGAPVYRWRHAVAARLPRPAVRTHASSEIVGDVDRKKLDELERRFKMADADGCVGHCPNAQAPADADT
jgi:hypothetical protein